MTRLAKQAYLRTRLSIMNAGRRKQADFNTLRQLSLDELVSQLGVAPGAAQLDRYWSNQLEQSLLQVWLQELSALLRPMEGASRAVLVQWARRYEVLNLKALIRGKIGGLPRGQIEASLFSLPGFLRLDHDRLLNTDDVTELLRGLRSGPYRNLARIGLRRFEEKQDPFLLDATLDQQFYSDLAHQVEQLEHTDRRAMRQLVGRIMDRHNLIWTLRYRFNYGLAPAEVLYLSIPRGRYLTRASLRELVNAESYEACLERLPPHLQNLAAGSANLRELDARLVADLIGEAKLALQSSPSVLASTFGYLTLRYYEMRILHAIVQAKVYQLPDGMLEEGLGPMLESAA